jgi:type I restriction enzyme S subunit
MTHCDSWTPGTLQDVIASVRGGFSVKCEDRSATRGELGVLKTGAVLRGIFNPDQNKFVPEEEHSRLRSPVTARTIIICRKNSEETIGASALVDTDWNNLFLSDLLWALRPARDVDEHWLVNLLQSSPVRSKIQLWSTGTQSTMKNISQDRLLAIPISIPPSVEQHKIAEILRTWNEAIEKLDSLIGLLTKARSAVCQGIFEEDYAARGSVLRAREVFIPISERARPDLPLLAVMQDIGIVRRDELDRRVTMPDGDTSTYKVVRPGDFVISLRSFEGGLEYSNVLGLVSPAYTVLRPMRSICAGYYRHFFKSRSFVGRLDKMIFGIRDGKQIAFRDFGDMFIPHPRIQDQKRHEEILNTATQLVEGNLRKKRALESQKRGLMQKLLTGEWRLSC